MAEAKRRAGGTRGRMGQGGYFRRVSTGTDVRNGALQLRPEPVRACSALPLAPSASSPACCLVPVPAAATRCAHCAAAQPRTTLCPVVPCAERRSSQGAVRRCSCGAAAAAYRHGRGSVAGQNLPKPAQTCYGQNCPNLSLSL